ncbi:enoyl-CoA hydratase/isomerase family protein [Marmoricola sp. RAF53]|uniref:enoyl-CoA hydratase/isomerase family protein n=1 Tax=Marmoricola sp. RAF53 TaxID=3233059 RepID=UPI003F953EAB
MDITVTREGEGRIECITLNRADSFNAFTRTMLASLCASLQQAFANPEVNSIVLTGSGRAFSAGQDLHELLDELDLPHGGNDTRLRDGYAPLATVLGNAPKPVVAAVNGVAAGAGLAVAALCTARVASTRAVFVPAFIDLGLVPDTGASHTIPRLIGTERAIRWLTDGRKLEAVEALTWGLVDRVVEPGQVVATAVLTATRLGGRDQRASAATRQLVEMAQRADLETALLAETNEQIFATGQDDFRQAMSRLAR